MRRIFLLLTAFLFPIFSQAAVCLRFVDTELRQLPAGDCQDSLSQFERAGRKTSLMDDYEIFLNEQDRDPKLAWRHFMKKALKKIWSSEDESLVSDVIDWSERQKWKIDPQLATQMKRLQSRQELQFSATIGRKSFVEKIAQLPGYEDVLIVTPVNAGESERDVLAATGPRRWIVLSSVFQARAFWADPLDLPALVKTNGAIPWVRGDCREPQFASVRTTKYEMRAYDKTGCATANLARISEAQKSNAFDAGPDGLNTGKLPDLQKSKSTHWIWLGLLAGAAAAYSLRDKTVVITQGFGR